MKQIKSLIELRNDPVLGVRIDYYRGYSKGWVQRLKFGGNEYRICSLDFGASKCNGWATVTGLDGVWVWATAPFPEKGDGPKTERASLFSFKSERDLFKWLSKPKASNEKS